MRARSVLALALACAAFAGRPPAATAEQLVSTLSDAGIEINSSFTGEQIVGDEPESAKAAAEAKGAGSDGDAPSADGEGAGGEDAGGGEGSSGGN